jgi:hypothetical protein
MKKRIVITGMLILVNLIILACGQSGYAWEPTGEPLVIIGEITEVQSTDEAGNMIVELQVPVATRTKVVEETQENETASSEVGGSDPAQVHNGEHIYSAKAYSFDCTCQDAGTVSRSFNFSDDSVEYADNIYQKTGEHTYTRSWTGQTILVENGKETTLDIQKHAVLIFSAGGFVLESYSDANPGSGSPCCFYEFTLEK